MTINSIPHYTTMYYNRPQTVTNDHTNLCNVYVGVIQAARLLLVNRATIRKWIIQGKLSGQKIGKITLILESDVLEIAKKRGTNIVW